MISLETPQRKWASSRLKGRTSWIFSSCGRCCRVTTGTSGTRSGGLRKGQSPWELLLGLSGFLSRQCRGLRPYVDSVPEPEVSSPVLTSIFGYYWSLPMESVLLSSRGMHVRFPPELYQQSHASLREDQGICGFPSRLSHQAFTRGIPTRLSHRAVLHATVVLVDPWLESRGCVGKTGFPGMD